MNCPHCGADIAQHPADECLQRRVAEIAGWTWNHEGIWSPCESRYTRLHNRRDLLPSVLPDYPYNVGAAIDALEAICGRDELICEWNVGYSRYGGEYVATICAWSETNDAWRNYVGRSEDSAALAICRAICAMK